MSAAVLAALSAQAAPLAACLLVLIALRSRPRAAAAAAILSLAVAVAATAWLVREVAAPGLTVLEQAVWLPVSGGPGLAFGVLLDPLSTVMALTVAAVTLAVMVFSLGYMAGDPGFARYYGFLALFGWAMLGLVLASNLLQTLVFWELVGLASFLLIGFWFDRPAPAAAARKAFIMTRVGDVGFLLGVLLLITTLGNAAIPEVVSAARGLEPGLVAAVSVLLLMGAIGKSAQGPLLTWLPDAMEGPTPVSALLHSATMVAAGVFLVARLSGFLMEAEVVMRWLLWLSVITALAAATMALVAEDIKRVLAYSTISQLAYMLMALAAGSVAAGFFHLVTHAAFKALLFMAAGILIHHAHSNDLRAIASAGRPPRAGTVGLVAGGLALAGLAPFSGFFSKEAVLAALGERFWDSAPAAVALAWAGAGLTAYYTFRMLFLALRPGTGRAAAAGALPAGPAAFHAGSTPANHGAAARSGRAAAALMAAPVLVLAALTLALGYLGGWLAARLAPGVPQHGALTPGPALFAALALVAAGAALAWFEFGRRGAPGIGLAERLPAVKAFFGNNWYLDRLYAATVVKWATALSRAARWHDHTVLDGASDGVASGTVMGGRVLARSQAGYVQLYVAVSVTLIAALALWLLLGGRAS